MSGNDAPFDSGGQKLRRPLLHDSVEDALDIGLEPVPTLLDSAEDGRLICGFDDETPDYRVEAFLEFAELELHFSRTEQQSTEDL